MKQTLLLSQESAMGLGTGACPMLMQADRV